jgi:preprotein translocase subunit YajC
MDLSLLFPLFILLLFIPIFLSSRRQRRQMQEMQQLQSSLEAGDVVMTTSGMRGTVVDASYEDTIDIEIADGVVTTWVRAAVREKINPAVEEPATEPESVTGPESLDKPESVAKPESVDEPGSVAKSESTGTSASLEKNDSANGTPRS